MPKKNKNLKIKNIRGHYDASSLKIAIVVSDFNEYLTSQLLDGALDALSRHGAKPKNITVVHVPGAFELPLVAKRVLEKIKPNAVITLAVVIRGKTKHFDQVVMEAASGIREISMRTRVPVILGMIPAENVQDAIERVGIKQSNKGREWAVAAIEMADVMRRLG